MSYEDPANPAGQTIESATITRQRRVIFQQRFCIALLVAATTGSLIAARGERSRADLLQSDAMLLQTRVQTAEPVAATAPDPQVEGQLIRDDIPGAETAELAYPVPTGRDPFVQSSRYPITVTAEDGSIRTIDAKALNIGLGGRGLTIDLTRQQSGYLFLWAPAHKDDDVWHRLALHPCCANALQLELSPVSMKDEASNPNDVFRFSDGATGSATASGTTYGLATDIRQAQATTH